MADPYLSELKYLGGPTLDFIEVAVDVGADVSDLVVTVYNSNGTVRTTNLLDGLTPTTFFGKDVYVIDTTTSGTFNGLGKTNGVSLSDDTTVYSFVSFDDLATPITATAGAASGLTSTQIGQAGASESLETTDDGASYNVQTTPNSGSIPCLTTGTNICTPTGHVKVEDLKAGALVTNTEGQHRRLLAVFNRTLSRSDLIKNPKLFPVRISAGSLGQGLPHRDLVMSRQHRMAVSSKIVERMFGVPEVLIAAIKLIEVPGVFVDLSVERITYFHLLFSTHEIILAEGAPTESLFLGDEALNALPEQFRAEIESLFPAATAISNVMHACRPIPKGQKQKQLIERHSSNQRPIISDQKL